jgi:hypothetical protein
MSENLSESRSEKAKEMHKVVRRVQPAVAQEELPMLHIEEETPPPRVG